MYTVSKVIESLPKTKFFLSVYLCNLMVQTIHQFQTQIFWSNRIHCLKYLRVTTLGCKDIGIRKSELVAKTRLIYLTKTRAGRGWINIKFFYLKSEPPPLLYIWYKSFMKPWPSNVISHVYSASIFLSIYPVFVDLFKISIYPVFVDLFNISIQSLLIYLIYLSIKSLLIYLVYPSIQSLLIYFIYPYIQSLLIYLIYPSIQSLLIYFIYPYIQSLLIYLIYLSIQSVNLFNISIYSVLVDLFHISIYSVFVNLFNINDLFIYFIYLSIFLSYPSSLCWHIRYIYLFFYFVNLSNLFFANLFDLFSYLFIF